MALINRDDVKDLFTVGGITAIATKIVGLTWLDALWAGVYANAFEIFKLSSIASATIATEVPYISKGAIEFVALAAGVIVVVRLGGTVVASILKRIRNDD